jgi:hypothetical protein
MRAGGDAERQPETDTLRLARGVLLVGMGSLIYGAMIGAYATPDEAFHAARCHAVGGSRG